MIQKQRNPLLLLYMFCFNYTPRKTACFNASFIFHLFFFCLSYSCCPSGNHCSAEVSSEKTVPPLPLSHKPKFYFLFLRWTRTITGRAASCSGSSWVGIHTHTHPKPGFTCLEVENFNKFSKFAKLLSWHGLKNIRREWVLMVSLFC